MLIKQGWKTRLDPSRRVSFLLLNVGNNVKVAGNLNDYKFLVIIDHHRVYYGFIQIFLKINI